MSCTRNQTGNNVRCSIQGDKAAYISTGYSAIRSLYPGLRSRCETYRVVEQYISPQNAVSATLQPCKFRSVNCISPVHSRPSRLSIVSKYCANLKSAYEISVKALSCPRHILGPPPKGTYNQGSGWMLSHRSGLKLSGSGPKEGRRCNAKKFVLISAPFGTNIGDWPSGPPPVGRTVSL